MSAEIRRLLDDLEYAANLIAGRIDVEGPVFQPLLRDRVARLRAHREQLLRQEEPPAPPVMALVEQERQEEEAKPDPTYQEALHRPKT